ncbi:MAG: hypothetical protein ABIU05_19235, partial [Nitrospirales bacterium]
VVTRPRHSTDYQGIHRANTRKKLGITFGITLLLFIGGTMGYIFKEQLGIPFLASPELRVPEQPFIKKPASPVPPIDSFTTMTPEIPISPPLNSPTAKEPHVNPNDTPNSDISNREIPTPTSSPTVATEDHPLKPDVSQHPGTPLPSPPERTRTLSPNSRPLPKPEAKPVPDQPNLAPPPNPSAMGQRAVPTVTEKPASHTELSSEVSRKGPQPIQDPTVLSPNAESLDNIESKELKDILDSVQSHETVPTLPKDGPSPVLPSPPIPPALPPSPKLPALSSPVSPP